MLVVIFKLFSNTLFEMIFGFVNFSLQALADIVPVAVTLRHRTCNLSRLAIHCGCVQVVCAPTDSTLEIGAASLHH